MTIVIFFISSIHLVTLPVLPPHGSTATYGPTAKRLPLNEMVTFFQGVGGPFEAQLGPVRPG